MVGFPHIHTTVKPIPSKPPRFEPAPVYLKRERRFISLKETGINFNIEVAERAQSPSSSAAGVYS